MGDLERRVARLEAECDLLARMRAESEDEADMRGREVRALRDLCDRLYKALEWENPKGAAGFVHEMREGGLL